MVLLLVSTHLQYPSVGSKDQSDNWRIEWEDHQEKGLHSRMTQPTISHPSAVMSHDSAYEAILIYNCYARSIHVCSYSNAIKEKLETKISLNILSP